ncbi:MAG TPA: ABC transporter substrate-binding protein [Thermomicrobiales bacterium]|nr:ABC transporter substrate-binding protein [Thermomicrobiales bacterium]
MNDVWTRRATRRGVIGGLGIGVGAMALPAALGGAPQAWAQATPGAPAELAPSMTIDLAAEPPTLDPALVYDNDGWSVIHSIYDALVQYGPGGDLQPLLAESLTPLDPTTYEIKLRQGIVFHNGEPFDASAVSFSVAHILDPETKSQVAQNFAVIDKVDEIDSHTVHLKLSAPAPWLPGQMAAWLCMLPPKYAVDPANDFANRPVGTGPYRFVNWERGAKVELQANPDYPPLSPKGRPTAAKVAFRFVLEGSTRVADLLARTADLIRGVPTDQVPAVADAGEVITEPISGSAWVRIATDVAPFDDVRMRQALNYAIDVDGIVQALLDGNGQRLPNFFVPGGLGYDPALKPYPYDPEQAKALLAAAGHGDGFDTQMSVTTAERLDIAQAIAGQLAEVGVRAEVIPTETATFNATWTDKSSPPLRFATWRPMFDPYTLLSLVVAEKGFLSRYDNPNAEPLLQAAAIEPNPDNRGKSYRELGKILRDEPAAIYLYRLTSLYGLRKGAPRWTPRPDDYIIPTAVE